MHSLRTVFYAAALCYAALLLLHSGAHGEQRELVPLSLQAVANVADVTDVLTVNAPSSSPDGRWVVYTISDPSRQAYPTYEQEVFTPTGSLLQASGLRLRAVDLTSGRTYQIEGKHGSTWSPAWSPDSRYLAFFSDRTGAATLWVWDSTTGKSRQLSTTIVHPYYPTEVPVWNPDAKSILCKVIPSDMTLLQVLKLNPFYPKARPKTANGNQANVTVYHFVPPTQAASVATAQNTLDTSMSLMIDRLFLSDLALIDVATGKVRRIAKHVHPWPWYAYSPDGQKIAYMEIVGGVSNTTQDISNLNVIWPASGKQRTLAKHILMNFVGAGESWSPDSTRIAYMTANPGGSPHSSTLYVLSLATGIVQKASSPFNFSYSSEDLLAPLWDASGRYFYSIDDLKGTLMRVVADGSETVAIAIPDSTPLRILAVADRRRYWSPDGGRLMLLQILDKRTHATKLCRFDLQMGQCTTMLDKGQKLTLGVGPEYTQSDASFPYIASDAYNPGNIWITDGKFSYQRRISNANPAIPAATLGKVEIIDWTSLSGEHLHGALLLPANYEKGKRYPLVTAVYGGEMGSNDVNAFGLYLGGGGYGEFNMQVLASRGYAVLCPDIPIHKEWHSPMQDVYEAVMPGIDRVIALGIADPGKLAVMGQSFGGYNTIGLITQTHRFSAAVATSAGWPDLFEGYSRFKDGVSMGVGFYEQSQGDMGCTPWDCRDRYLENSPFFFLNKVTTPLLMERGTDDEISEGNGEIFVGLRRLGKEVESLEYANEGHVLEQPANIIDFWQRTLNFLDTHLDVTPSNR